MRVIAEFFLLFLRPLHAWVVTVSLVKILSYFSIVNSFSTGRWTLGMLRRCVVRVFSSLCLPFNQPFDSWNVVFGILLYSFGVTHPISYLFTLRYLTGECTRLTPLLAAVRSTDDASTVGCAFRLKCSEANRGCSCWDPTSICCHRSAAWCKLCHVALDQPHVRRKSDEERPVVFRCCVPCKGLAHTVVLAPTGRLRETGESS